MKINKKEIVCFLLVLSFSIVSVFALSGNIAQADLWEDQVGMESGSDAIGGAFGHNSTVEPKSIVLIIAELISVFLGFLGIIFLALTVHAGYKWMTAGGNEQSVIEAKSQIQRALIGLVIVLLAFSIAQFVTNAAYKATVI